MYLLLFFVTLRKLQLQLQLTLVFNISYLVGIRPIIATGIRFFFLQLTALFLFSLGNLLTFNHIDPEGVSNYDTINKIFLMAMTVFNIVISVFWSDISHNKALKDKVKLKKLFGTLLIICLVFNVFCFTVYFIIPDIVRIWTKNLIIVNLNNTFPFPILVLIQSFAYCGSVFLNAFEKLNGQIFLGLFAAFLVVPVTNYFFVHFNFGIGTVPLVSAILLVPSMIYCLIVTFKSINSL